MLWPSSKLVGLGIEAVDGDAGSISDLLFDDSEWTVRWAVVDTGRWLPGRKILLPPSIFARPDPAQRTVSAGVTRAQVENSPGIDSDAPVSRQMESDLSGYYDQKPYWYPGHLPLLATPLVPPPASDSAAVPGAAPEPPGDPHLRSVNEVVSYRIAATDGDIGHVEDFLIEEESWAVRYIVADTTDWWPGGTVLLSPRWLKEVSWSGQSISVALTLEQVRNSPPYHPEVTVDREYEERLFGYYGGLPYW